MDVVALGLAKADAKKNYVPKKTRRAVYGFGSTGNQSANTSIVEATYRLPGRLPQTPTRVRLHIRNYDTLNGTAYTGALSFTGLWVGAHAYDASGNWTGKTTAAPVQALTSFSTPADGSEYVSAWITDSTVLAYFARNSAFVLSLGFTCAAGQSHARGAGQSYVVTGTGNSALANQATPSGLGSAGGAVLWDVWIEYDYTGNGSALLALGDSLSEGVNSTHGTADSWPELWSRKSGSVSATIGVGSSTTTFWTDQTKWGWTKWGFGGANAPAVDAIVVALGSNDLGANVLTAAQIEANFGTIIGNLRTTFGTGVPIWLATIIPRSFTGTQETNRTTLNTWMRGLPFDVAGLLDFDRAVRSASDATVIDADFNSGDNTHLKSGGYSRLADAASGPLRPPVVS